MSFPLVTILIPNYKTHELTKLCLRLLRKYTDMRKVQVIVIDNDSADESLDYLRNLSWIKLIERQTVAGEPPVYAHARALDLGLQHVATPYVLSIHTDTLVKHPEWLDFLLQHLVVQDNVAGVGSWKLEAKPWWRQMLKSIDYYAKRFFYFLIKKREHNLEGIGKNFYYLRSHCALYKVELLKKFNLHFADGDLVAGKEMHKQLVKAGYDMIFLPSKKLIHYVEHINHATTVLNPQLSTRQKSVVKGLRRIEQSLAKLNAKAILEDASLDEPL